MMTVSVPLPLIVVDPRVDPAWKLVTAGLLTGLEDPKLDVVIEDELDGDCVAVVESVVLLLLDVAIELDVVRLLLRVVLGELLLRLLLLVLLLLLLLLLDVVLVEDVLTPLIVDELVLDDLVVLDVLLEEDCPVVEVLLELVVLEVVEVLLGVVALEVDD